MIYFIIVLIGIIIIWTGYFISRLVEKKKQETEYNADKSELVGNLSSDDTTAGSIFVGKDQITQDEMYAKRYGMQICQQCETLNTCDAVFCVACGGYLRRKRESNDL